jgi:hypothetical protein
MIKEFKESISSEVSQDSGKEHTPQKGEHQ